MGVVCSFVFSAVVSIGVRLVVRTLVSFVVYYVVVFHTSSSLFCTRIKYGIQYDRGSKSPSNLRV